MADFEYLGTFTRAANCEFVRRAEAVPPRPEATETQIAVPLRYSGREEIMAASVVGDSMAPTILDNDLLIVDSGLLPSPHDIVVVPFKGRRHLPGVHLLVARYNLGVRGPFLTKDNADYSSFEVRITERGILAVVLEIIPRLSRNPHENHFNVHRARAMHRDLGRKIPPDVGLLSTRFAEKLASALDIPDGEFLGDRLPWGCFRAFAKVSQPHVGIGVRDVLTINPTIQSRTGDLVIRTNDQGESGFGLLQRDKKAGSEPGKFCIGSTDPGSDVRFEEEDWYQVGTVVRVDAASHIALAAGRTEADRRVKSGGREELL